MAPHSSTVAQKVPWMEEPGRLQSMGSLRVRNDWATSLSLFTFMHWRRKWQPTPVFLPGESQGWGAVYGVTQSWTRLKQLSSSSKAIDCVDHDKLWNILKEMGIPDHLPLEKAVCRSRNNRTGHGTTDWFLIGKGVCQGCVLSPCLFNFYAEYIMWNTELDESTRWNQDCWEKYQ